MRRLHAVLGLILLFVGIVIIPYSNMPYNETKIEWETQETKTDSWNITRFFMEGDLIEVLIAPAEDWGTYLDAPTQDIPYPVKPVFVNITDPLGNETEFYCEYVKPSESSPTLYLYDVTLTESHGLLVGENVSLGEVGIIGMVMTTGNHTATITGIYGGYTQSSPPTMGFRKGCKITQIKYPYSNFIYLGIATILSGVVLMIYGFRKRKKVKHVKKHKKV